MLLMIHDVFVGCTIHSSYQLIAFIDNGLSLSPGHNGSQESHDFNILLCRKLVWYRYGIIWNKTRLIIFINFFIQEIFQIKINCHSNPYLPVCSIPLQILAIKPGPS